MTNLDYTTLLIQFPIVGVAGFVVWYFYNEIKTLSKENTIQLQKTTEVITNNTAVMTRVLTLIDKTNKK